MAKPIFSEKKFLRIFKPGDIFWYMESFDGIPTKTVGPVQILSFISDKSGTRVNFIGSDHDCWFVGSLVNRWHGVFTNKEDALVYFTKRKYKYATNPRLIAEVAEAKEWSRYFDSSLRSAWEDYFSFSGKY